MTIDEYKAQVRAMGLTPRRPSYIGATIHEDRDGQMHSIPDPEGLSEEERKDMIGLIRMRLFGPTN